MAWSYLLDMWMGSTHRPFTKEMFQSMDDQRALNSVCSIVDLAIDTERLIFENKTGSRSPLRILVGDEGYQEYQHEHRGYLNHEKLRII
jgi:hypothetical protein